MLGNEENNVLLKSMTQNKAICLKKRTFAWKLASIFQSRTTINDRIVRKQQL